MSRVPIGMKIIDIRKLLDDYSIQRCYFVPYKKKLHNVDDKRVKAYKEGWIEFEDKIYAKLTEYQNRLVEIKNVYIEMNFGI